MNRRRVKLGLEMSRTTPWIAMELEDVAVGWNSGSFVVRCKPCTFLQTQRGGLMNLQRVPFASHGSQCVEEFDGEVKRQDNLDEMGEVCGS